MAAVDRSAAHRTGQYDGAAVVVPDDNNDLPYISNLFLLESGSVQVTNKLGETVVLPLPSLVPFPVWVTRVWQTGTTVSPGNILALY